MINFAALRLGEQNSAQRRQDAKKDLSSFREIRHVRRHSRARQSMRRFVADYAKAMTAFAGEFVHQASRFVVRQISSCAAALAYHRPFLFY